MSKDNEKRDESKEKNGGKNMLTEELPGGGLTHEEFQNAGNAPRKKNLDEDEDDDEESLDE